MLFCRKQSDPNFQESLSQNLKLTCPKMSNLQVSVPQSGAVCSANREEESESVEETTLTEVSERLKLD